MTRKLHFIAGFQTFLCCCGQEGKRNGSGVCCFNQLITASGEKGPSWPETHIFFPLVLFSLLICAVLPLHGSYLSRSLFALLL